MAKHNESWESRTGLILAMAGNAVGLGNFLYRMTPPKKSLQIKV
ncbi:hypothetical protein U3A58_06720 [Algoriphagus sp. C2-6-M1]|nr:hypothetical protein [Algoriphagus sp. C2-6-M1]MEB2780079.1 hypothetical protein [Algoriphagus sp. C2-6-M1]